jgi:hypothetical protein
VCGPERRRIERSVGVGDDRGDRVLDARRNPRLVDQSIEPRRLVEHLSSLLPFNDIEATEALLRAHAADLAAVFLEPVLIDLGWIPARRGYVEALRADDRARHPARLRRAADRVPARTRRRTRFGRYPSSFRRHTAPAWNSIAR